MLNFHYSFLPKWAKVYLKALLAFITLALIFSFALILQSKDKIYNANITLHEQNLIIENNAFQYAMRLHFQNLAPLLRSKKIAKIEIDNVLWNENVNQNIISDLYVEGRYLFFKSTQDFSTPKIENFGVLEYQASFNPLLKNIFKYTFLALLLLLVILKRKEIILSVDKPIIAFLTLFLVILALSFASDMTFWSKEFVIWTDSSVFLYVAQTIQRGLMPYKDAFDHKGVLIYFYNYLGNLILYIRGVWIFEVLSVSVAVIYAYKTARFFLNSALALVAVMLAFCSYFKFVQGGNYTEEYALPFLFVSLYIFTRYFLNKSNKIETLICGICFGAVCLLRPNMTALWEVFVALIFFMELKARKFSFAKFFTLGFLLMVTPPLLWLYWGGAFKDFIEQYFIFNFQYSGRANFSPKFRMMITFFRTEPLMILSSVFVAMRACKFKQKFDFAFLAFILLTLFAAAFSALDFYHYRLIFLPIYLYGAVVFLCFLKKEFQDLKPLALVFILGITFFISPFYARAKNALYTIKTTSEESFLAPLQIQKSYQEVIENIQKYSDENDTISVCGSNIEVVIYLMSNRVSASRLTYQTQPISVQKERLNEYKNDLATKLPKVIVVYESSCPYAAEIVPKGYKEMQKGFFVRQ